jgi:hypothetical protein
VGRGIYFPLFLIFVLLIIVISRRFRLGGSFLPPCPHSHSGGTPKPPPMFLCLPPFIVGMIGLPPHHILTQGDPPRGAACIPKIVHKDACTLMKQKLTQSYENELEQTHPGADDPSPEMDQAGAGI